MPTVTVSKRQAFPDAKSITPPLPLEKVLWSGEGRRVVCGACYPRAPKLAIANRHGFLSQTSPSPAKPQWGRFFSRKIAIACDVSSQEKIARLSAREGHFGAQKIAGIFSLASRNRNRNRRRIATQVGGALQH